MLVELVVGVGIGHPDYFDPLIYLFNELSKFSHSF